MKPSITILLLFVLVSFHSCKKDPPSYECFTGPNPFRFALIDKASGQNLLANGTLYTSDVKIINLADNSIIPYPFNNDRSLVFIHTIGWKTEIVNYKLEILGEAIFTLYVDAERIHNRCSYTRYNEIKLEGCEFEYNEQTGIYNILIE
jgi:hypothetical protein